MNQQTSSEASSKFLSLDELEKLHKEALYHGVGSESWMRCAQALIDALPSHMDTMRTMKNLMTMARTEVQHAQALVEAVEEWSVDRVIRDYGDASLLKALWTFSGDRTEPCDGCDGQCGEPCAPCSVESAHAGIDWTIENLVKSGKLSIEAPLNFEIAPRHNSAC